MPWPSVSGSDPACSVLGREGARVDCADALADGGRGGDEDEDEEAATPRRQCDGWGLAHHKPRFSLRQPQLLPSAAQSGSSLQLPGFRRPAVTCRTPLFQTHSQGACMWWVLTRSSQAQPSQAKPSALAPRIQRFVYLATGGGLGVIFNIVLFVSYAITNSPQLCSGRYPGPIPCSRYESISTAIRPKNLAPTGNDSLLPPLPPCRKTKSIWPKTRTASGACDDPGRFVPLPLPFPRCARAARCMMTIWTSAGHTNPPLRRPSEDSTSTRASRSPPPP